MQSISLYNELDWSNPYLISVYNEIVDSNGKISKVYNNGSLVKVMSQISNYIRYDLISKTEVVTYKLPHGIENEMQNLFG